MMKQINPKVWEILCDDEKVVLGLQYGMDKSSWQAGEIMKKSHYKLLEILYRAKKFVRLFTDHLSLYDSIVEPYIQGNEVVKRYFRLCIEKRMKPGAALEKINEDEKTLIKKKAMDEKIIETMTIWANEDYPHEFQLYNLIKDFDRWNNFRILPELLQEPSAFKRRVKNKYKRRVKLMSQIPDLSLQKIKELTRVPHRNYANKLYLPLLTKKGPEIIEVKSNDVTISLLTEIGLYVFSDTQTATTYIDAIKKYNNTTIRECTDGLNFWPIYRECISKAYNYQKIEKITPERKYLEMALSKLEFYNH